MSSVAATGVNGCRRRASLGEYRATKNDFAGRRRRGISVSEALIGHALSRRGNGRNAHAIHPYRHDGLSYRMSIVKPAGIHGASS